MADLDNIEVLEGSAPTSGGIVVRKKKNNDKIEEEGPKVSLLGLDKLAGEPNCWVCCSFHAPNLFFSPIQNKNVDWKRHYFRIWKTKLTRENLMKDFRSPMSRSTRKPCGRQMKPPHTLEVFPMKLETDCSTDKIVTSRGSFTSLLKYIFL